MTTASGSCLRRRAGALMPCGASAAATTWPPQAPEHVPADDGRQLDRPDETGREERTGRLVERRAEDVPALLERVGDRDEDPLPVDQQVGQVMGHQVADRDGQQPGPDRTEADGAGHAEGKQHDDAHEREEDRRPLEDARRTEHVEELLGLRQPVEDDRRHAERRERDVGARPAGLEQAAAEGSAVDPALLVDEAEPRQPTQEAEPDRERLPVRAPLVPAELGHHRERVGGVPDEHHEQG